MAKKKQTVGQRWRHFKRKTKIKLASKRLDRKHPITQQCRIGILMLFAQSWNSYETLYRQAQAHSQMDIQVYVLPAWQEGGLNIKRYEEALAFFEKKSIKVVPLYDPQIKTWKNPDTVKADYLFYDEPYVEMFPAWLNPRIQACETKVCYIPYGFLLTDQKPLLNVVFRENFFAYTHTFFAPWSFVAGYANELFRKVRGRKHHVAELGYPRFDMIPISNGNILLQEKPSVTLMWTPRWTIPGTNLDNCTAHSSFLDFKDRIPLRAACHGEENWILRPHPLAFDNYVKFGYMTEDEVATYQKAVNDLTNAEMDKNPDYWDGFAKADILVTDFTSLIVEYAATEKPIFYCGALEALPMPELREVVYHTPTWEQVEARIDALRAGCDPKAEQRKTFAQKLRGNGELIGDKILQYIWQDFYKTTKGRAKP